jgi:nucleolar protein 53
MGKKAKGGAAQRAKKRANERQLDLIEGAAHHVETGHVTSKRNKDLFVLDTTAALVPKDQELKKDKGTTLSKPRIVDEKVQALLQKHDAATLQKMASNNKKKRKATDAPAFDLWEQKEEEEATTVKRMAGVAPPHIHRKNSRAAAPAKKHPQVAIDVAQSGQSYHPDPHEHQNVIGEALALELRRQEAEEYKNTPITTGMSAETRALLMGDDHDDDESSDEEEAPTVLHKQKEKLTRAQRNRQKRIRAEQKELKERKIAKKRMNAISQAKKLSKELAKQQEQNQNRKEQLALLKKEQARTPGKGVFQHVSEKNPLHAPTLPVALSDDLSGALRTMKPKGSLLTDRMESFRDRNMTTKKLVGDRKRIVQGNKRRKLKVKESKRQDIHVKDERDKDYLLMG